MVSSRPRPMHALAWPDRAGSGSALASVHRSDTTMVFALASRSLRSTGFRPALSNLAGARRGYAEAVSDKLKLSFVVPHKVGVSDRTDQMLTHAGYLRCPGGDPGQRLGCQR